MAVRETEGGRSALVATVWRNRYFHRSGGEVMAGIVGAALASSNDLPDAVETGIAP